LRLTGEECVIQNESLSKVTPTNTPDYQINLQNMSIFGLKIQLHQILASASAFLEKKSFELLKKTTAIVNWKFSMEKKAE